MKTYLLATQYLENYGTRFKPKGGRMCVVDAPCVFSALALVQRLLNEEQRDPKNAMFERIEFPIVPDLTNSSQYEFENASHAIAEIPEWERDDNTRLIWGQWKGESENA